MQVPNDIIKCIVWVSYISNRSLGKRKAFLYSVFLTASFIESVKGILGHDEGRELKLCTGISVSMIYSK